MTPGSPAAQSAADIAGWTLLAACIPAILLLLLLRRRPAARNPWLQGILRFLAIWPPVVAANWLAQTLSVHLFNVQPAHQDALVDFASAPPLRQLLFALTAVLLMPAVEEWIFRERLQTWLLRKTSPAPAIALTSLLFAAAHLSPASVLPLLVLAVGLSLARLQTGRLLPAILMHSLYNATSLLLLYLLGPSALA